MLHCFALGLKHDNPDHPDFTPSVFPKRQSHSKLRLERAERVRNRSRRQLQWELSCRASTIEEEAPAETETMAETTINTPECICNHHTEMVRLCDEVNTLKRQQDETRRERDEAVRQLEKLTFSANSVRDNDDKCKLMTGLSWTLFVTLHEFLSKFVAPQPRFKLERRSAIHLFGETRTESIHRPHVHYAELASQHLHGHIFTLAGFNVCQDFFFGCLARQGMHQKHSSSRGSTTVSETHHNN